MKTINIDGVEYALVPVGKLEPEVEINITRFKGMVTESDKYCFEATKIKHGDVPGRYYDGVDIEFTDKRSQPWKTDHWDNNAWMNGILDNNPEPLKLLDNICPQGIAELKAFLKVLKEEGWL
jgi:hypothetical protein